MADLDSKLRAWWRHLKVAVRLGVTPEEVDGLCRTDACVRDQLGDARSYGLDRPKRRMPRIAAIRRLAN